MTANRSWVDLGCDGDLDAVVARACRTLRNFANTGARASLRSSRRPVAGTRSPAIDVGDGSSPALVDLDGDGDFDGAPTFKERTPRWALRPGEGNDEVSRGNY